MSHPFPLNQEHFLSFEKETLTLPLEQRLTYQLLLYLGATQDDEPLALALLHLARLIRRHGFAQPQIDETLITALEHVVSKKQETAYLQAWDIFRRIWTALTVPSDGQQGQPDEARVSGLITGSDAVIREATSADYSALLALSFSLPPLTTDRASTILLVEQAGKLQAFLKYQVESETMITITHLAMRAWSRKAGYPQRLITTLQHRFLSIVAQTGSLHKHFWSTLGFTQADAGRFLWIAPHREA